METPSQRADHRGQVQDADKEPNLFSGLRAYQCCRLAREGGVLQSAESDLNCDNTNFERIMSRHGLREMIENGDGSWVMVKRKTGSIISVSV